MSQRRNPFESKAPVFGSSSLLSHLPFTFGTSNTTSQSTSSIVLSSVNPIMGSTFEEQQLLNHLSWLESGSDSTGPDKPQSQSHLQHIKDAPLFSAKIRLHTQKQQSFGLFSPITFPQYGLLGMRNSDTTQKGEENMIYTNTNAPWSAFICGSQGGGKSHTLSCMLENCLLTSSPVAKLQNPLAGIVFHYDKFTSHATTQLCEAAYLCSQGVPVTVLVSPSNIWAMTKLYTNLPGLPAGSPRPKVLPLYLRQQQLNVSNMMTLMNVSDMGRTPLYMEVLYKTLREMAMLQKGAPGLDYTDFKTRLRNQSFTREQNVPLDMRLDLLEAFMDPEMIQRSGPRMSTNDVWDFEQGALTIVDLSCPFVNENDACALFSICLSLFMENRSKVGRVIALDEAHKFLTQSGEAADFTDQLISVICQQRHLATRVMIATQEPTLSPRLLDLCNVSIVHRFLSPAWYRTLRDHLAGAAHGSDGDQEDTAASLFQTIVGLDTGEALVFAPTAVLDVSGTDGTVQPLKHQYFKIRIRKRVTADGGKSIMASDSKAFSSIVGDVEIPFFQAPPAAPRAHPPPPRSTYGVAGPSSRPRNHADIPPSQTTTQATGTSSNVLGNKAKITQALQDATRDMIRRKGLHKIGTTYDQIREEAATALGLSRKYFFHGDWTKASREIIGAEILIHRT